MLKIRGKKDFVQKTKNPNALETYLSRKKIKKYTFQNQLPCQKNLLLACSSSYTYFQNPEIMHGLEATIKKFQSLDADGSGNLDTFEVALT